MLALISPAKTFDYSSAKHTKYSMPTMLDKSCELVQVLKNKNIEEIKNLMKVSDKVAALNVGRFQEFNKKFRLNINAKQAIFAFKGDVYKSMDIDNLSDTEIDFLARQTIILSGLYGLLKPLDLIMPYRLEMGTRLAIGGCRNLYEFWQELISQQINKLEKKHIINLASKEYSKVVNRKIVNANIIDVSFKEYRNNSYQVIWLFAKQARGRMINFMAKHKLTAPDELKQFDDYGYKFNQELSTKTNWVFSRTNKP